MLGRGRDPGQDVLLQTVLAAVEGAADSMSAQISPPRSMHREHLQCSSVNSLGRKSAGARLVANGLRRGAERGEPHHHFVRGERRVLSGGLVVVQEHIDGDVGVGVVLRQRRLVRRRRRVAVRGVVADRVRPLDVDRDLGDLGDLEREDGAVDLDVGESVDGLRLGAAGVTPSDPELGRREVGRIGLVVESRDLVVAGLAAMACGGGRRRRHHDGRRAG